MKTFVNPNITIVEARKNKNFGFYTVLEKETPNILKIKAKSFSGRKRGTVGVITKNGDVQTTHPVLLKYLTKEVKAKIKLTLDLIYSKPNFSITDNGLVNISSC